MVNESKEYERLPIRTALQVLRNMVKATLPKVQSPGGKLVVLGIHSLKLPTHNTPMQGFHMEKSKVVSHLIMNQGKVMNGLPKLRYRSMSENIGLPKEREFQGNGVSTVPKVTSVMEVAQANCNVCRRLLWSRGSETGNQNTRIWRNARCEKPEKF